LAVSQTGSNAASEPAGSRSWWLTLPGILTGLAGLISAVTGLVVAVHQLRPSDHPAASTTPPAATAPASTGGGGGSATQAAGGARHVAFTAGRRAQIGDNRYDILAAAVGAGNPGETALKLRVRMANGGRYPANFWSSTFRLRVGTAVSAPTNALDAVVAGGTTDVGEVDFTVSASARRATLLVGDDPGKAVALPIALTGGKG
jgi:hypothetical protein